MKAVLDTNVFVSLLIAQRGSGVWLMALWKEGKYDLVISPELFAELAEVLTRPEIAGKIDPYRKLALFRRLRFDALWTTGAVRMTEVFDDPDDDFLISAAVESKADYLVTWDQLVLKKEQSHGVKIITPDVFISLVIK